MRRLIYILPVLAFAALAYFLFKGLSGPPPDEIPSAFVGKPAPAVQLAGLDGPGFGGKEFRTGQVTVVNVFASWCVPCREELPAIAALGRMKNIQLYGFAYKDKPDALRAFLRDTGNPYARVGVDPDGRAGIEWGVYYVPETFIVDRHGIIRERFLGPISADNLLRDVLPAIKRASES
ncbi:MAG TPA: DsbE family thiol:disulfide interchange protein [Rhizomicrobium sp.]|nr:DsbE family thiol:disulfide interchange protein [Rhizomicrobium sp.]